MLQVLVTYQYCYCPYRSMYILLRGKVTIYINYAVKVDSAEGGGDNAPPIVVEPSSDKKESIRQQLGTFVTHLRE